MGKSVFLKSFSDRKTLYILVAILSVGFCLSFLYVFDYKIDTNGDNAGYYILAKSIATGNGYANIHKPKAELSNHLPPGYPLIISMVFKLFGTQITTIKLTNGLLFFLSLLALFILFYKLTQRLHLAFSSILLVLINGHLLRFSTMIMSEIPFLLISTLTLLIFVDLNRNTTPLRNPKFYIFLLLLSASFYIRTAGIALIAGISFTLLFEKSFKYLFSTISGFGLLITPWQIRSYFLGGNSYFRQLLDKNPYQPELGKMDLIDWVYRILQNIKRYVSIEIPNSCFPWKTINYQSIASLSDWFIGITIITFILLGLSQLRKYRLLVFGYLTGSFGILLLWPDVWYGVRFILPIVPILILLTILGLSTAIAILLKNLTINTEKVFLIAPYLCFVFSFCLFFNQLKDVNKQAKLPYPMNYNNYLFLAKWAKTNTNEDDVICCRKEQLFYLFSNRKVVRYKNTLNPEELILDLKENKVSYVVLDQLGFLSTPRYLYPAIKRYPEKFQLINHQKDPDTYLFKFSPELGYSGEWKNNQRNGKGTFTYENGEKYIGEWKNNLRNGKGTYFLNDGSKIEGLWKNDSLQKNCPKSQNHE